VVTLGTVPYHAAVAATATHSSSAASSSSFSSSYFCCFYRNYAIDQSNAKFKFMLKTLKFVNRLLIKCILLVYKLIKMKK
jgi:hypothetical protein